MKWNLDTMTQDAFTAYFRGGMPGSVRAYSAWDFKEGERPCIVTHAEGLRPVSEDAEWHDPRYIDVAIALQVESVDEVGDTGIVITEFYERRAKILSAVRELLARADLVTQINAQGVEGLACSMMQLEDDTDEGAEDRTVTNIFSVIGIVEPVTGS